MSQVGAGNNLSLHPCAPGRRGVYGRVRLVTLKETASSPDRVWQHEHV